MPKISKVFLEDDTKETMLPLITHRLPWLFLGLIGGMFATILASKFEALLESRVELAYFITVIVYLADALGTQTETIFVRNIAHGKLNFYTYLFKETILGFAIGSLFGIIIGVFAYLYFHSVDIAVTVGISLAITMSVAPLIAVLVSTLLYKEHKDPALGGGPFTTIIQDLLSLIIYFLIASLIILK